MNTQIEYMYSDASNYKFWGTFVVSGSCLFEDFEPYLFDGEFFVPHEVGLKHLLDLPMNDDDHYLHSLVSFTPIGSGVAICTRNELVRRFKNAEKRGWFSSLRTDHFNK